MVTRGRTSAQASAGRRGRRPYGLPGNERQREAAPHPALRGHLPPRGKARVVVGDSASLRGASGTPPPAVCPGMSGSGSLPLIRPCGATFPQGGKARAVWRRRKPPQGVGDAAPYGLPGNGRQREPAPHPALRGHLPPRGKARAVVGGSGSLSPTPAAGPRCGAGGSGCSTSGLTKPALYRRNLGRCRGGSRR